MDGEIGRREFVAEATRWLMLAALALKLGIRPAEAQEEPLPDPEPDGHAEQASEEDLEENIVQEIKAHPEKVLENTETLKLIISLNFFDAIGAIARGHGHTTNRMILRLRKEKEDVAEEERCPTPQNVALNISGSSILNKVVQAALDAIGMEQGAEFVEDLDQHFCHTNLFAGVILNMYLATHGPKSKQEVIHGFKEAGLGVGMLLTATSVGAGIQVTEERFLQAVHEADVKTRKETEAEMGKRPSPVDKIRGFQSGIATVMGAAPVAAALSQIPIFAFGNARVAASKMEACKRLSEDLFGVCEGMTCAQVEELAKSLENPVITKTLLVQAGQVKSRADGTFTRVDCGKMSDQYVTNFGIGMLSGTMDLTQAAGGDVGPAVVGAIQSFGPLEMLKSGLSTLLCTIGMGFEESAAMAKRLGVPISDLVNKRTIGESLKFALKTWGNLFQYAFGLSGRRGGARFGVGGQLTSDAANLFRAGAQAIAIHMTGFGGSVDDILARKGMHMGREVMDERNKLFSDITLARAELVRHMEVDGEPRDKVNAMKLENGEAIELANLVVAGVITLEDAKLGKRNEVMYEIHSMIKRRIVKQVTEAKKRRTDRLRKISAATAIDHMKAGFSKRSEVMKHLSYPLLIEHVVDGVIFLEDAKKIEKEIMSRKEALRRADLVLLDIITVEQAASGNFEQGLMDQIMNRDHMASELTDFGQILRDLDALPSAEHAQRAQPLIDKVSAFTEMLNQQIDFSNEEAMKDFKAKVKAIHDLLNKVPSFIDLFRFEYWELHLGPELAETAYIVFLQGIHIPGLITTMNRVTYDMKDDISEFLSMVPDVAKKEAGLASSMTIHAALSSVADNWADELIHAKQLANEVFLPELAQRYGLLREGMDYEDLGIDTHGQNITEQYLQMAVMLEEHLRANGREGELEQMYRELWEAFLINKAMAIISAVFGGGESTIGNSPHFTAIVNDLKRVLTLKASFVDIQNHLTHHLTRLGLSFAQARVIIPTLEMHCVSHLFGGNPFRPENRGIYKVPEPAHAGAGH
ncbi:MAG: hypothetical protein Q8P95_03765 [bacterium]|nr:hypothetical protein [bacterium]